MSNEAILAALAGFALGLLLGVWIARDNYRRAARERRHGRLPEPDPGPPNAPRAPSRAR